MTDADDSFVGGLSIPQCSDDALLLLQDARKDGFDFITTNLPHSSSMSRRDVTLIESKWWSTSIVGMVTTPSSPFYYSDDDDDDDDEDMDTNNNNEEDDDEQIPKWNFGQDIISALSNPHKAPTATAHLEYMLEWTAHMNTPAAIRVKSSANNVQLWVRVDFDRESVERFMTIDS